MKELRRNARLIGLILLALFAAMAAYFCYSVYFYGGRWFANSYNPRISNQKQSVIAGTIYDQAGTVLAYTDSDGTRHYAQDQKTRLSVSHVVGDNASKVSGGAETFFAQYLLGFNSSVFERVYDAIAGEKQRGDDIHLTISAGLSTYIAQQFPSGKSGAVAVVNYKTGDVLALSSFPNFDPENIESALEDETAGALVNRATQGLYTPGSTFKIITLASALENLVNAAGRIFNCTGTLAVDQTTVTEAGGTAHGRQTLVQAFSNSCNNAFASLALELGYEKLGQTAENFRFNDNFLFRDMVVYNSSYPIDGKGQDDLAWSGVGQGRVLVSPLHMALIAGAVANDGVMMEPRLLSSVITPKGTSRSLAGAKAYARVMQSDTAEVIKNYMISTVSGGTARKAAVKGVTVGGKTGSAEVSDDKTVETHALFVGFVEDAAYPYAICVVVEHGGSGGSVAAPLAAKVLAHAISLKL